MKTVPESHHDLLSDDARILLYLSTIMEDGSPQVTPVWFNHDGEHILVNSAKGRVKDINMRARPHVACLIMDPTNGHRWLQLRGEVIDITEEGAEEHINDLMFKYRGKRGYPVNDETRVSYTIRVDNLNVVG